MQITQKILSGSPVSTIDNHSYQVQIHYNDKLLCSGTILTAYVILTAAHCLKYKLTSGMKVVANDYNLATIDGTEQVRSVKAIINHEDYNYDKDLNDIGLLVLTQRLENLPNVMLPLEGEEFSGMGKVSGWGRTGAKESSSISDVLLEVYLPMTSTAKCKIIYENYGVKLHEGMICAGGEIGRDSCRGDSGGPLMCNKARRWVQCGIISFGLGCGGHNPGVYTKVSYYIPWIKSKLQEISVMNKCKTNYFYCINFEKCIHRNLLCNTKNDCQDNSDEAMCLKSSVNETSPGMFRCNNGIEIKSSWVCDEDDDCGDHSDEDKCQKGDCIAKSMFPCTDGRCIKWDWFCDGHLDCDDGSDELCVSPSILNITDPHACPNDTMFQCPTNRRKTNLGICIPKRWVCDGDLDCANGEDEENCVITENTPKANFSAHIVSSLPLMPPNEHDLLTLNYNNSCSGDQFKCESNYSCIPYLFVCDGKEDCPGGEDEKNCDKFHSFTVGGLTVGECRSDQVRCDNGKCFDARYRCDGERDCEDGTDEMGCCALNFFQCHNGMCIDRHLLCDSDPDCPDGEDELDCY